MAVKKTTKKVVKKIEKEKVSYQTRAMMIATLYSGRVAGKILSKFDDDYMICTAGVDEIIQRIDNE